VSGTVAGYGRLSLFPRSPVAAAGTAFSLVRDGRSRFLAVRGDRGGLEGGREGPAGALLCPLTAANAAILRGRLPWLNPVALGLKTSAGFGDRLGLATPGHIRAVRRFPAGERRLGAVFAQQSVRENARTGRTPQGVLDDATWGVFQEGWCRAWGADADHLKTPADVEPYARAGYTLFTVDPGDHVDARADELSPVELEAASRALPWGGLEDTPADLERRYLASSLDLGGAALAFDRERLWRAAVKYGGAVAHTAAMFRHIASRAVGGAFELEVSVDETATPTTVAEHAYVARELRRLGVRWVSLAPRFVGRFEKGVDYIGDLDRFARELAGHAAVARGALGPYKLSLHSGSDKFRVYPLLASALAGDDGPLVHVKTAGTSYLEALRAVARTDAALFREIVAFARDRYAEDRATYHVSAEVGKVASANLLSSAELPSLLDQFDARQVLHVTFGSVLERFGDRLREALIEGEERYAAGLEEHFARHLAPFLA